MSKNVTRLFQQFHPESYGLALDLKRETLTFSGRVMIRGKKVGRPSKRLTFHQKELQITKASIIKYDKHGSTPIIVKRINNQDSYNEVRLHSDELLYPGEYSIVMDFIGVISRPLNGIYPSYFKLDGQEKMLIATQFESHHAREAFPCIDEPEAKATFDLTLVTPRDETVIANTPISKQLIKGSSYITTFETTPRMSTYLLAFAYGELGYSESVTKAGVVVRAYATPNNVELTKYGLAIAVRALEFFEDYFGVAYPLPKLDMLALPDFSSGAMENWGLVTYRETAMLADAVSSSIENKQMVALVICHELSHQWFGNLVTMQWWDDLWLNESFANMMEYMSVNALYPEWNILEQFVSYEAGSAKRRDSLIDVQPIHCEVHHPDEISTLFDPSIVYAKGGTVLYMLLNHIGEKAFRAGLQDYFKQHSYKNTTADDLWESLTRSSDHNINNFMKSWLNRPGFPLVSVSWKPGTKSLKVAQKRFLSDPAARPTTSEPWQVPLAATYTLDNDLLQSSSMTLRVTPATDSTLLFNHDGHSYYLPYYTNSEHVAAIVSAIQANRIDRIDRMLLLDNYSMLQRGGETATTELLQLLTAYEHEDSENVWGGIATAIAETRRLIEGNDISDKQLNGLIEKLVMPTVERLGWDDQPDDTSQTLRLRSLALSLAAGAQVATILDEARKRFKSFQVPADLSATVRSVVYFVVVRYGTVADFQQLLELHHSIDSADERDELAAALTSAKIPELYEQLFPLLSSDEIRRQDLLHWFVWLLRNRYSRAIAWEWLTSHWEWIEHEFRSDKSYSFFARYAGSIFSRPSELDQFQSFFGPKKNEIALTRDITLADQEITSRIAWRERNETAVISWLTKL